MTHHLKILVVDDNEQEFSMYNSCLSDADMTVITACTSEEAVIKAAAYEPDLILLDIGMDTMNGFDVVRLLRLNESTRNIPIVFASTNKGTDNVRASHFLGAVDFIEKPFDPVKIAKHIKEIALVETITSNLKKVKRILEGMD